MSAICLVAGRNQGELVEDLCRTCPSVVSVAGPVRPLSGIEMFDDLPQALDGVGADIVCLLSPSRDTGDQVMAAISKGAHVLCRGLPATSAAALEELLSAAHRGGVALSWNEVSSYSPLHRRLLEGSAELAFGSPVFLRSMVDGNPGSLLAVWWALSSALAQARSLVAAPPSRLHVTAALSRRRCTGTATVAFENRASAQLTAVPAPLVEGDVMLVGTGGILSYEPSVNRLVTFGGSARTVRTHRSVRPEPEWLRSFADRIDNGQPGDYPEVADATAELQLLAGLRKAQRSRKAVDLPL